MQQYSTIYASWNSKLSFFSIQFKNEDRTSSNVIDPMLNSLQTTLQLGNRTKISAKSCIYTDNESTTTLRSSTFLESDENL